MLRALVTAGADPALRNDQGLTPVQIASQANKPNAVQYLKEAIKQRIIETGSSSSTPPKQTSPGPRSPRMGGTAAAAGSQGSSRGSSRKSSLGTIVETSPILGRGEASSDHSGHSSSQLAQYISCELSNMVDGSGRPRCHGGTASCTSVAIAGHTCGSVSAAPSPSPSISSEPAQSLLQAANAQAAAGKHKAKHHMSHGDVNASVKSIFRRTLATFRRSSLARRNSDKSTPP